MKGPEKLEVMSWLKPLPKSTSPIAATQIQPVDGRGLKTIFDVIVGCSFYPDKELPAT
jgi:hypothetical protein